MANINNKWVGYLDRSYQLVKAKLVGRLQVNAPELTDHTENNPLIIILSMFAGVSEMLNYYIDNLSQEAFLESARKYSSIIGLTRVLDYRVEASSPETVDIQFTLSDPAPAGGGFIPSGTNVQSDQSSTIFTTTLGLIIPPGETVGVALAKQSVLANQVSLGATAGTPDQRFGIPPNYERKTSSVSINLLPYIEVSTFAYSKSTDPHYIVDYNPAGNLYIQFGDGVKGRIPDTGFDVIFDFSVTDGPAGAVGANELVTILNPPTIPGVSVITSNNPAQSAGGAPIEGIEEIRKNAPLHIRTLRRAVTYDDYTELALLYPGVFHALVQFCCGKTVDIFIAPLAGEDGAIASKSLLNLIEVYFDDLRMVTTTVNTRPAGLSETVINLEVTPKFRRDPLQTKVDVEQAILAEYNYLSSSINRATRISDLLALVDNLDKVEFANIIALYTLPYPRPLLHGTTLVWDRDILPTATRSSYKITLNSNQQVLISKDNAFVLIQQIGDTYTDENITLTVNDSALYTGGMEWTFEVYPYGVDQEVTDFTVPLVKTTSLSVTMIPREYNSQNC